MIAPRRGPHRTHGAPRFAARGGPRPQVPASARNAETTFEFPGRTRLSVAVGHNGDGLVSRYLVTSGDRRALEINNVYRRERDAVRLDRFTVFQFAPDGRVATRLEARVDQFTVDAPLPLELFARPRSTKELKQELSVLLEKTAAVELGMTVGQLAESLQRAAGESLQVRVDREALARAPEVHADALRLEPGEAKVSDLLFHDLRRNHLDFYLDVQGVTIIPRRDAWKRAEIVEYAAADYGLTFEELRDAIYRTGRHDEWSDVGGPAQMLMDEEQGIVSVLHAQSDHFQFQRRLDGLKKAAEEE